MNITIQRGERKVAYTHQTSGVLLEALEEIKHHIDPSLTFRSGCRSGVCGCCAVRVDGVEKRSCTTAVYEGMNVSPLKHAPLIRDLVVNEEPLLRKHQDLYFEGREDQKLTQNDKTLFSLQSECIECFACASACPILESNPNFLAPFALSRVWRYVVDKREEKGKQKLEAVQKDGIWDCILCGDCTPVCPVGINPKNDISLLRARSLGAGFQDPSFVSFGESFGGEFSFQEVKFC